MELAVTQTDSAADNQLEAITGDQHSEDNARVSLTYDDVNAMDCMKGMRDGDEHWNDSPWQSVRLKSLPLLATLNTMGESLEIANPRIELGSIALASLSLALRESHPFLLRHAESLQT